MKIYTGTGDRGKTSLFSGERVAKNHARINAYGDVDELNSVIGAMISFMPEEQPEMIDDIRQVQSHLFDVGAWLATTGDSGAAGQLAVFSSGPSELLENKMDRMQEELSELKSFILPGGHPSAAMAHVARTVCRRAERKVIGLLEDLRGEESKDDRYDHLLVFLNRLSDYLFVFARYLNQVTGTRDIPWEKMS